MCGFAAVGKVGRGLPVCLKWHKLKILTASKIAFAISSMLQCVLQTICFFKKKKLKYESNLDDKEVQLLGEHQIHHGKVTIRRQIAVKIYCLFAKCTVDHW